MTETKVFSNYQDYDNWYARLDDFTPIAIETPGDISMFVDVKCESRQEAVQGFREAFEPLSDEISAWADIIEHNNKFGEVRSCLGYDWSVYSPWNGIWRISLRLTGVNAEAYMNKRVYHRRERLAARKTGKKSGGVSRSRGAEREVKENGQYTEKRAGYRKAPLSRSTEFDREA